MITFEPTTITMTVSTTDNINKPGVYPLRLRGVIDGGVAATTTVSK